MANKKKESKLIPLIKGGVERNGKEFTFWSKDRFKEFSIDEIVLIKSLILRLKTTGYKCNEPLGFNKIISDDYEQIMYYIWQHILPHLHFLNFVGSTPLEPGIFKIPHVRAHYELINPEVLENVNEEDLTDEQKKLNFNIDVLTIKEKELISKTFCSLTPTFDPEKELIYINEKNTFQKYFQFNYKEFVYNTYPDKLKVFLYQLINDMNTIIFDKLYSVAEKQNANLKEIGCDHLDMIHLVADDICSNSKRGCGNVLILSEAYYNKLSETQKLKSLDDVDRTLKIIKVDNVFNSYETFVDFRLDDVCFMMGYKGELCGNMDAGAFYAPTVGDLDISVKDNEMIYTFPVTMGFNQFGADKYFKFVKVI